MTDYVLDLEDSVGVSRRESLVTLIRSTKTVTQQADSEDILEKLDVVKDEVLHDEAEDLAIEDPATNQGPMANNPATNPPESSLSKPALNLPRWLNAIWSSSYYRPCNG